VQERLDAYAERMRADERPEDRGKNDAPNR